MSTLTPLGAMSPPRAGQVLLSAQHVVKEFPARSATAGSGRRSVVHAVDGVSLEVRAGETLGLVGPTGCGKSTLARCLTRLCDVTSGTIIFDGVDISELSGRQLRPVRRELQVIFQDPAGALNPRRRVGSIIGEPLTVHRLAAGTERRRRVQELMEVVGLNPEHYNRFPTEFSGGQRQRIGIARALAARPKLIVCDEPVSALDVSVQAQVLNLLVDLQRDFALTYVFIAHDLSVVRYLSDRVAVMHLGHLVEVAEVEEVYAHPRHPYTDVLLSAVGAGSQGPARVVLVGEAPSPIDPPSGCTFQPQCPHAQETCAQRRPPLDMVSGGADGHRVACFFPMAAVPPPALPTAMAGLPDRSWPGLPGPPGPGRPAQSSHPSRPWPWPIRPCQDADRGASRLSRLRRDHVAMVSLIIIGIVVAWALAAPLIARALGHPANEQYHSTGQTASGLPVSPRGEFWLGTDDLGRDLLVRIGYGLRVSLLVGLVATLATVLIGVVVGLAAGYLGGVVDTLLARLMDVVLAFPFLLLAISMVSLVGPSIRTVIVLIALLGWASVARIVRGQVLTIKQKEYVEAARSVGAGDVRIMALEVLPNALAPVIVYTALLIPAVMVLEASLSFLGVGTPPPTADLGAMLSSSISYYRQAWWFVVFPGAALLLLTLAFNLLGDAVRDALDPHVASPMAGRGRPS